MQLFLCQLVSECPELMAVWNYEKNTDLDPAAISALSSKRAWWCCPDCGHEWQSQIKNRTISNKKCPVCDKKSKKKTAADIPVVMKFWGNNPELDPKSITAYSSQVVNWKCPDCGYEWSSTVYSKTTLKAGCPRCSKQIASSEYNAKVLFPDLLDYYDFDFPDNPPLESLRPTSRKIVHWHCQKCGYKWEQPLHQRIRRNKGRHRVAECPVCAGTSVKGINTGLPDYLVLEWCYEKNEKDSTE